MNPRCGDKTYIPFLWKNGTPSIFSTISLFTFLAFFEGGRAYRGSRDRALAFLPMRPSPLSHNSWRKFPGTSPGTTNFRMLTTPEDAVSTEFFGTQSPYYRRLFRTFALAIEIPWASPFRRASFLQSLSLYLLTLLACLLPLKACPTSLAPARPERRCSLDPIYFHPDHGRGN